MNDTIFTEFTKDLFSMENEIHLIDVSIQQNALSFENDLYLFLNKNGIYYQVIKRSCFEIFIKVIGLNYIGIWNLLEPYTRDLEKDKGILFTGDKGPEKMYQGIWVKGVGIFKNTMND